MAIGLSGAATVGRVSETDITDIGIKGPVSSPQGLIFYLFIAQGLLSGQRGLCYDIPGTVLRGENGG